MKAKLYSTTTKTVSEVALPKEFGEGVNLALLSQARRVYEDRRHPGLSKTKTRGEVRISTRKIYRQKGTGGARHGAKSAPIFVGGGTAHGPKGIKKILTLSSNMKRRALATSFAAKTRELKVVVVDGLSKITKTKEAGILVKRVLDDNSAKRGTLILSKTSWGALRFFRNLANLDIFSSSNVSAYDVYNGGIILIEKSLIEVKKEEKVKKVVGENKTKKETK